jgi:hypothetical protein
VKAALTQIEINALLEAAHALAEVTQGSARPAARAMKGRRPSRQSPAQTHEKPIAKSDTSSLQAMLEKLQHENDQLKLLLAEMQAKEAKQSA